MALQCFICFYCCLTVDVLTSCWFGYKSFTCSCCWGIKNAPNSCLKTFFFTFLPSLFFYLFFMIWLILRILLLRFAIEQRSHQKWVWTLYPFTWHCLWHGFYQDNMSDIPTPFYFKIISLLLIFCTFFSL